MVVGSVLWILMPVSPVTPFRVIDVVLPVGGIIVQETQVAPPVGTVMVFRPEARVLISSWAGEAALAAALIVSVPVTSPVKVMVLTLVALTAIN
jgi:hypothetical protein